MADEEELPKNKKERNKTLEGMDKKKLIQLVKGHITKEASLRADNAKLRAITEQANISAQFASDKLALADSSKKAAHTRLAKFKTAIEAIMATKYPGKLRYIRGSNNGFAVGIIETPIDDPSDEEWEEINTLNHLHELASI